MNHHFSLVGRMEGRGRGVDGTFLYIAAFIMVCFASFRFLEEYKIRWTIHGTNTRIELNSVAWSVVHHRWPI